VARSVRSDIVARRYFSTLDIGQNVNGYTVKNVVAVPKLNMKAIDLVHGKTGATHLHVARNDTNKVFAIGFKTSPPDHSGVPHILEHTTLCGSRQFPVRDPFFKMLTRSLANYMNALTGVDYTFYPFATTNSTDFANLQKVYLDAVFNPLLRAADFRQEGWRLEHQSPSDPNSPLVFKGVVYNEMKGQLSNPAYLFYIRFFQTIYPSLQFSGGDPAHITNLRYKDLCEFHESKYHPSNAFSFSYGSMSLDEVLGPLQENISKFARIDAKSSVQFPMELKENKFVEVEGPVDPNFDPAKQHKMSLSWIVGDSSNLQDTIAWKILGTLLADGHSSPFYKALIDTGIGTDFSVNTGLEEAPAKNIFTIGLQGLSEESIPKFKGAVFAVLADVSKNGIPQQRVEAVLNQAELADREVDASFGMDLVSRLFPRVFNDSNYLELLDNEKLLTSFKERYANHPKMFQSLVDTKLLNGPYLQFSMVPSKTFEDKLVVEESQRLESKVSTLTEDDKADIYTSGLELLESQQRQEDVSVLPTLVAEDISPNASHVEVLKSSLDGISVFTRQTGTQGITYLQMLKNLADVPSSLYSYLSLFSTAMTNVGTLDYSMSELENEIKLHTGGISSSLLLRSPPGSERVDLLLSLGGSSLDEKSSHLYDLFYQVLAKAQFSNISKLKPLIQASAANALNSLSDSGHRFAMVHAKAAMSGKCNLEERLSGMEQVHFIMQMSKLEDQELKEQVVPRLEEIRAFASQSSGLEAGLTYSPDPLISDKNQDLLHKFASKLPFASSATISSVSGLLHGADHMTQFQLPFQVSYVGAAVGGADYFHKDSAALQILANLLTHRHLHTEIRERGGAYGGGASYSAMDGVFGFYSYRDPSPLNTISTIKNAGSWAASNEWTDRDLREAKLSVFQGIDAPISPRSEIAYEFLYGLTNEVRQARREALLAVSTDDVKRVAEKYLASTLANLGSGHASVTVLGPSRREFTAESGWKVIDPED
jgi:Zn-dependent M16 (insulinase) family peptidase